MKNCEWCSQGFKPNRPSAKTCSPACRDDRRKDKARQYAKASYKPAEPKPPIGCAHCGEMFSPYRESAKFCSRRCQWNYTTVKSRPRVRPCVHCGVGTPTKPGKPVCATCKADKRDPERAKVRERRRTLSAYGITQAEYDYMLEEQRGRCAICATDSPGHTENWAVDHCHASGVVRGLLCAQCNMGIGLFGDDALRLEAGAAYVRAHAA